MSEIGEKIKTCRKRAGLKQSELAERIGKAANTVTDLESGKNKGNFEILKEICQILNVSADYILGLDAAQEELQLSDEGIKLLNEYKIFLKEKYPAKDKNEEASYNKVGNL